jgi:hypothetical protein
MIFQRIVRNTPTRVFMVVYNSFGTADVAVGYAISWDFDNDCDGVSVTKPSADSDGYGMAGVAPGTMTKVAYGLLQIWGFHTAARVRTLTDSTHTYHQIGTAVVSGVGLAGNLSSVWCLEGVGTGATSGMTIATCGFALASNITITTAAIDVFVQSL